MNKKQLRTSLRRARRALSSQQRRHAADGLRRVALAQNLLLSCRRIGFYSPTHEEMNLMPLLNHAL